MTSIRGILAKNMKALRRAFGFTQAKLAEKADTSTHYIGMIETGKKFPSPEMMERIAEALGVDTLDLFLAEQKLPETIKTYRKGTINDLKEILAQFLDERLIDLEK